DTGRLDRHVPGLGLKCLQRHPGLPQAGKARVPQLVTGGVGQARWGPAAAENLVEPVGGQGPTPPRPFEHQEYEVDSICGATLFGEVRAQRLEETVADRDDPLMSTLAVSDEHPSFAEVDILVAQTEDLAAAQSAEQH